MTLILNARVKLNISEKHLDCQYPYKKKTDLLIYVYICTQMMMWGSINIIMLRQIVVRLENWPDRNEREKKVNSTTWQLGRFTVSPSVLFHISALYVYISSCPLRLFSVWLLHSTLGKKVFCLHLRPLSY